jgi:hypothetical protein
MRIFIKSIFFYYKGDMGKIGLALKVLKPLGALVGIGRSRRIKKRARRTGLLVGLGAGKFLFGRGDKKDNNYDSEFNEKYSDFMKYAKSSNIPGGDYNNFKSIYNNSNDLDYTERIKNSLDIVERMKDDKAIDRKDYKNLKNRLYDDFKEEINNSLKGSSIEDYLPLAASFLFLFSGIFLLTPNPTGLIVIDNLGKTQINFLGIISFLVGTFFLGVFVRKKKN